MSRFISRILCLHLKYNHLRALCVLCSELVGRVFVRRSDNRLCRLCAGRKQVGGAFSTTKNL